MCLAKYYETTPPHLAVPKLDNQHSEQKRLISTGVIHKLRFRAVYEQQLLLVRDTTQMQVGVNYQYIPK